MTKRYIVSAIALLGGIILVLIFSGFRIVLPNNGYFGGFEFLGTENKNTYIVMPSSNSKYSINKTVYEYKDESLSEVFSYDYGQVHLIHDELFTITSTYNRGARIFQRIDIETREIVEIEYTGDIETSIHKGGFFDVIDDNEDVIVIHHEYSATVEGTYVNEQYVYVIDKELNEITQMYDITQQTFQYFSLVDDIVLEKEKIIVIGKQNEETEELMIIDYKTNTFVMETTEQLGKVLLYDNSYCLITRDHRLNNTCKTIPPGKEEFVIDYTYNLWNSEELLYDGEYLYYKDDKTMEVFNLDGDLLESNEVEFNRDYVMYDGNEVVYIDIYVQGSIIERLVFNVVVYDALEDKELQRSKIFPVNSQIKSDNGSV